MPTLLELAQKAFGSKLSLEVFNGTFHTFAVYDNLEWFTLNRFARVGQGTGTLTKIDGVCNGAVGEIGTKNAERD